MATVAYTGAGGVGGWVGGGVRSPKSSLCTQNPPPSSGPFESFMAETVQGFEGSVRSLGVLACGPGPIYSRVAAFCPPLRPVLLLVSFPRSRSPVVGVLGAVLEVAGCAV